MSDIIIEVPTEVITIEMTPEGKDGQDGFSPIAAVSKSGKTATITITDKTGTTTASVTDGEDGQPGPPGTTTWEGITDKPESFPPSAHTHTVADITDFPTLGTMSAESASDYYTKSATDALLSEKASIIRTSASGSLVHITDAAAMPVDALTVGIEPVQDLHGYANPWSAGGGKNLFNESLMADAASGAKYITLNLAPNTEYTMSTDDPCKNGGTIADLFFCRMDESVSSGENGVKLGRTVTRTSDAEGHLRVGYRCYEDWITPTQLMAYNTQVEVGSTATPYAPYSNECPISGHTSATITRTGKNLANVANAVSTSNVSLSVSETDTGSAIVGETLGTYTYQDIHIDIPMAGLEGQTITMSGKQTISGGAIYSAQFRANKNGEYTILASNPATESINISCVIPDCDFMRLHFGVVSNTGTAGAKKTLTNIMVNIGGTALPWQKFSSQQVTIDLNGTRYGATVDALTGVMTVTHPLYTIVELQTVFDGSWEYMPDQNRFQLNRSCVPSGTSDSPFNAYCSCYQVKEYGNNSAYSGQTSIFYPHMAGSLRIIDTRFTDVTSLLNAVGNEQVVLPLRQTFTVQLTPAELSLLFGTNNVWADSGDVNVGYRADTKLYIDRKIAELQALILDN